MLGSAAREQGHLDAEQHECHRTLAAARGHSGEIGPLLEKAFEATFGADNFIAVKDGDEPVIDTCPECDHETDVREERRCAACDFGVPEDAYCSVCG